MVVKGLPVTELRLRAYHGASATFPTVQLGGLQVGVWLASLQNGYSLNFNLFQLAKMSRKTRLYDPGTLYPVILRGNGGQRLFR